MRRRPRSTRGTAAVAALAGGLALCGAASAQSAGAEAGLRYLSWPGRTAPAAEQPAAPSARPAGSDLRRPNRVIPHGGAAPAHREDAPAPVRRTLTPASAWLRPSSPPPAASAAPAPRAVESSPSPAPAAPAPSPAPAWIEDRGGQPAPAATVAPPPAQSASADPMAPRRDAPIFRLQSSGGAAPAPQATESASAAPAEPAPAPARVALVTANPADRPAPQGARYYSVHRQHGLQPDPVALPEPTYVDALAVTMTESPATPDLAAPEPGPTLIRDAQGRVRTQPAAPEGDYQ